MKLYLARMGFSFGLLGTLLQTCSVAQAQITYDGCRDIRGVPVQSIQSTSIGDVAFATMIRGNPVILYNPYVLAQVPEPVRLFFYAHECGHHALGHVVGGRIGISQEQQADCFGIKTLVEQDLIDDDGIELVQRTLRQFGRGDWTHLPGPQRAINLRQCLDSTEDRSLGTGDRFKDCMQERIESCMNDCTDNYGYSGSTCRARMCNPSVGVNQQWAGRCRRKTSR